MTNENTPKGVASGLSAGLGCVDERTCTCHPDDGPPRPCARRYALTECKAEDLYARLATLSKVLEGSGQIDEHDHPDAYLTILDAMLFVRWLVKPNVKCGAYLTQDIASND